MINIFDGTRLHCWSKYLHAGYVQSIYQCNGTSPYAIFAGELQLVITFLEHWYLFPLTFLLCCMEPVVQLAWAAVNLLRNHPCTYGPSTNCRTNTSYCRYSDTFLITCTWLYRLRYKFNWYHYKWLVMK